MNQSVLVSVLLVFALAPAALGARVRSGDGLAMTLSEQGQVSGLAVDGSELLSPGKTGGFLLGEYALDPGPELVENGGFEGPGGFEMEGGWHRDAEVSRTGKASLRLDVPEKGEFSVRVPLKPNAVYLVTFYMKSQGLDGTPILHVRRQDEDGQLTQGQANLEYLGIYYPDWVRCQHTFETLPGTARGELMWHVVRGKLQGKVWIDDLSIRELRQPEAVSLEATVAPAGADVRLRGEYRGITLEATVRGLPDRIAIEGTLQDTTGKDRAVQLTYRLPVAAEGWRWATGLASSQTIEAGRRYVNALEIGRDTNRNIAPWPYSSLDGPDAGLSLGVPMDKPSVYRMWYDEEGYYTVRMDFGLTAETRKFPGQAEFALVLSRHDPRWGMRAAAKKYFTSFPQFFEVRTKPGAVFPNALIDRVKNLSDFGAMYGDRHFGNVRLIKMLDDAGMYSMTYNEPWMWRSNFEQYLPQPELPPAGEIVAREERDVNVSHRNDTRDYWEVPRSYSVRAFLNSVFHDESGQPVMNGTRTYGGGRVRVVEWLTNADPEIVGPYGEPNRGMLSWTYEYGNDVTGARKLGAQAKGIRYDSLGEWTHQGAENHRREHFRFADFPLTFSYRTGKPCQLGYFTAQEYMLFVRKQMLRSGGFAYANGATGCPWFTWLLDGIFLENWSPGIDHHQHIRLLMYRKNCTDWRRPRLERSDTEVEKELNEQLTYCWWPGLAGSPDDFDSKRPIFRKYIPVFRALAAAGWEPVTYARITPGIRAVVERFGGEDGRPLFFTVRNLEEGARVIGVTIDSPVLSGSPAGLKVTELLSGKGLTPGVRDDGTVAVSLRIPARTTVVLAVR